MIHRSSWPVGIAYKIGSDAPLDRNGLKEMKRHGEAASENGTTVEQERKRIQKLIKKYRYELHDIFNMDETGVFYRYEPISSLFLALSLTPTQNDTR
jgi:hypothetical protein